MTELTNDASFDCTVAVISKIVENYILSKENKKDFIDKMELMIAVLRGFEDEDN